MKQIHYSSGYKHILEKNFTIATGIKTAHTVKIRHITLKANGVISIKTGYGWDGPSGPVPDTKSNMLASLVHDALYQLMRYDLLCRKKYKKPADKLFRKMCIDGGVPRWIAKIYYKGLEIGGRSATLAKNIRKIHKAPRG